MQRRILRVITTAALIAVAPAPKPLITLDGVVAAAKLAPAARSAIAKNVTSLNSCLEKGIALHREMATASPADRTKLESQMKDLHEVCTAAHEAIIKQLDPTQLAAFYEYVHSQ